MVVEQKMGQRSTTQVAGVLSGFLLDHSEQLMVRAHILSREMLMVVTVLYLLLLQATLCLRQEDLTPIQDL